MSCVCHSRCLRRWVEERADHSRRNGASSGTSSWALAPSVSPSSVGLQRVLREVGLVLGRLLSGDAREATIKRYAFDLGAGESIRQRALEARRGRREERRLVVEAHALIGADEAARANGEPASLAARAGQGAPRERATAPPRRRARRASSASLFGTSWKTASRAQRDELRSRRPRAAARWRTDSAFGSAFASASPRLPLHAAAESAQSAAATNDPPRRLRVPIVRTHAGSSATGPSLGDARAALAIEAAHQRRRRERANERRRGRARAAGERGARDREEKRESRRRPATSSCGHERNARRTKERSRSRRGRARAEAAPARGRARRDAFSRRSRARSSRPRRR